MKNIKALFQKINPLVLIISIAMFMETLDTTIVGVAIPKIAETFQISPVNMKLALTSYLLSLAIFIPISGWLADRFGEKKVFIFAMSFFTLNSLLCGIAGDLWSLVLSRTLQGLGAALMLPVGRLIVLRQFPRESYVKAMNMVVIPSLVGPALGPTVGGVILHFLSWHWIFFINIPFGFMGILLSICFVRIPMSSLKPRPFHWKGFFLFSTSLLLLTSAMAIIGDNFSWIRQGLVLGFVAFILLFFYIKESLRQKFPLLNLTLFREETFLVAMAVSFIARIGIGAIPFLLPMMLETVWGETPFYAGLIFLFLASGMMSTRAFINQKLLYRLGYKKLLTIIISLLVTLTMNLCWFSIFHRFWLLALVVFMIGVLTSQLYVCISSLYPLRLTKSVFSQATSIASTVQQFSFGFGIATAAIILHLISQITHEVIFSETVFFWTFIVLNVLAAIALIFVLKLDEHLRLEYKEISA